MRRLVRNYHIPESTVLILLAVTVGLSTGAAVLAFRTAFHELEHFFFHVIGQHGMMGHWLEAAKLPPALATVLILIVVGALVGLIVQVFVGHEKYHGVAGIMESVALTGGRLPFLKQPAKALASALSLGAGASVGPEDPSVQIGANLGSFFGQYLGLSEERVVLLVGAGSASAIAAAFNAPIAGVFFAIEVVLGQFNTGAISVIVLSAVISSALTQAFLGSHPTLGDLNYVLGSPEQLVFYVLLGVLLAGVAVIVIRLFYWTADFWHKRLHLPLPVETALTGALIGTIGVFLPQVLGTGEEFMLEILEGDAQFTIGFVLLLGGVKVIATALSSSGGFVGGVFAPTLFMGIAFGNAYGLFLQAVLPTQALGNPAAYAIAGMAGALGGVVRAPITAILLVFELTDDYRLILPIMLTTVVCTMLVERLGVAGIYMEALLKNGIHLQQGRDIDLMQGILVQEAMDSPAPTISAGATLSELRHTFREKHTRALCVVNGENTLKGIVTLGDLQRVYEQADEEHPLSAVTVGDIATKDVVTVAPNDVLWQAIRRMGGRDIGRLPVVDERTGELVGLLRRQSIMIAYNTAITRKLHDQHYAEQIRLNTLTGAHVAEYEVQPGSLVANQMLKDVKWPSDSIVASVLRRGKLIVPRGSTQLHVHDKVTIVADVQCDPLLKKMFQREAKPPALD